jgi:coenzyme F420-reducing hydrogenase alpha subunit
MSSRTVRVDLLARVEGEGGIQLRLKDGAVADVKFRIFEPPRFFEALLAGRDFREAPDITARICGICPVAYQMSSVHALERLCGATVTEGIRALRRLLYCGEWIESHALHVFMLHAPDYLGYDDALGMAHDHRGVVERALQLKKAGNDLVTLIGGREIHPINVRVGGFYRVPRKKALQAMLDPLKAALEIAVASVRWAAGLPYPAFERPTEYVALRNGRDYPMNEGNIASTAGLNTDPSEFENHFTEDHVSRSTALHCTHNGASYAVGPIARFNLNHDLLTPLARECAREVGLIPPVANPFRAIVVRCVEMVFACEEAIRIIEEFEDLVTPAAEVRPKAGVGWGCTEAPRGILFHRYTLDASGTIVNANIVPPTSQNQKSIEADLWELAPAFADGPMDVLTKHCEQAVRNYDPCISCSAHAIRVEVIRETTT